MEERQWAILARLCKLFDDMGISAVPKSNRDAESQSAWLFLRGVNEADPGTYQVRILDLDTDLETLLKRDPRWYWQIPFPSRVYAGNDRLTRYLPAIWSFVEEMVTVKIGDEKFFLLVADIVLP